MRWLTYFILAYLALAVQVGLRDYIQYQDATPNLVLLAVIFIAVNAPKDPALLGCFCLGLMQDLLTTQPLGLYALSYGLVGMFVVSTQSIVYREHPLTHFSLGLAGGLLVAVVILVQGAIHPPGPRVMEGETAIPAIRLSVGTEFTRVLYTAILAPFVLGILQRTRRLFAFQSPRRKIKS